MIIQNLIKNYGFENGILDPWIGQNACVVSHPQPNMTGNFSAILTGDDVDASIEQTIRVIPGESYNLGISIATTKKGISPPISILLEYIDLSGQTISEGINIRVLEGQLPNGKRSIFKTIHQSSLRVPFNVHFAKLTIMKYASTCTTGVIVDNTSLTRIEDDISLPTAYVGNTGSNTVTVIGDDFDTITVGQGPVAMIQVTLNSAQFIYSANEDGTVSVIQASDNTVITTIDLPGELSWQENRNILTSSDGSIVFVANQDSSTNQGYVSMIDTSINTLTKSIKVDSNPITLALTNDGQPNSGLLYVVNLGDHSISVIDISTGKVKTNFKVEQNDPTYLVITTDNQYFVLGYNNANHFHVGEVSTNTIIKSITYSDDRHLKSYTLSLDGTLLYVGFRVGQDASNHPGAVLKPYNIDNDFSELDDIRLNKQNPSDPLMLEQYGLEDGFDMIYVGVTDEKYIKEIVRQISSNTFTILSQLNIDDFGGFFNLSSDNQYIVTANTGGNSATYIQTSSFSIIETIKVQSNPNVLVITNNN